MNLIGLKWDRGMFASRNGLKPGKKSGNMNRTIVGIGVLLLSFPCPQGCHRNDERTNGTSVEPDKQAVGETTGMARPVAEEPPLILKWRSKIQTDGALLSDDVLEAAGGKNAAANELFSLPEMPDGVMADLSRISVLTNKDEIRRDSSDREDVVTDVRSQRSPEPGCLR